MRCPAELYTSSPRPYRGLAELDYPFHDDAHIVTRCGRICVGRRKINSSTVIAGQKVGVKEVSDRIWLASFKDYDLGYFTTSRADWRAPRTGSALKCYPCDWNGQ